MTNFVEDIISELEFEFSEQPTYKDSVMTKDGKIVRINRDLWKESRVLREHYISGTSHKVLAAPESVLLALVRAYEDGTFPAGMKGLYDLLAAASELKLEDLTSKCLDNLRTMNALDDSMDFPSELSVETVMRVFKVFLDSPLRTIDIYKRQLSRVARYCKNNRNVMTNAMSLVKERLGKFKSIGLDGIPANFATRSVLVALYKREGKFQTDVILGSEMIPVNLFGDRINRFHLAKIRLFYLKYGQYLLYWSPFRGDVFHKNLQNNSAPIRVLSDCWIFETRGRLLFAGQNLVGGTSLSLWVDDERFERIYDSRGVIRDIDFDDTRSVLALLRANKLLVFRLRNRSLSFLGEIETPEDSFRVFLSKKYTFVVRENDEVFGVETYRYPAVGSEESGPSRNGQPPDGTLLLKSNNYWAWRSLVLCGENYYFQDDGGLHLMSDFLRFDRTKRLMDLKGLCVLSVVWMS